MNIGFVSLKSRCKLRVGSSQAWSDGRQSSHIFVPWPLLRHSTDPPAIVGGCLSERSLPVALCCAAANAAYGLISIIGRAGHFHR